MALELIHEHGAIPASTEIASRAGVSPASLFRYFDSLDDLQHEAVRQHFESNHEFFAVRRIGEGALDERIAAFVDARIALHNRIAPVARFGRGRVVEFCTSRRASAPCGWSSLGRYAFTLPANSGPCAAQQPTIWWL